MLYAVGADLASMQNAGAVPTVVRKTVTFAAGTTGATTTHNLFTVTGLVKVTLVAARCTTDLTVGGSTTLSIGTATSGTLMLDGTSGPLDLTTVDAGDYIFGAASAISGAITPATHLVDETIIYTVGTSTITGGVLEFIVEYVPLSTGASVVAA